MASSGMLRRVALVRTDVSEELSASFIRVTRIGELGTTLAVTSNRRTLRRNTKWIDVEACFCLKIWKVEQRFSSHLTGNTLQLHCKHQPVNMIRKLSPSTVSIVRHTVVGFEVFTAVIMKNAVFWDVTLCGSCKNRRFGGTYRLHQQGDKNRRASNDGSK
jgi:hypothetical protein